MLEKYPLISVIIPVYNTKNYVKRCIDSVLSQTYKNIEAIVVNDGSTDGSKELLNEVYGNIPNVILVHQKNKGVSAARNKGLDLVSGKYVCFLDSDDWLEKDAIEFLYNQIKNINHNEYVISSCDRNFVYLRNQKLITVRQRKNEYLYLSAKEALLDISSGKLNLQSACYKLFPVKLINDVKKIRFNQNISNGEDGLFVFEVLSCAKSIIYSAEPKWNIFDRPDSTTNSKYNSKMLTALQAVDYMILESQNNDELVNKLKVYYTIRAIGLRVKYYLSNCKNEKDDDIIFNALLKYREDFINNVSIYEKLKYIIVLYMPPNLVKFMCLLKGVIK